MKGKILVAGIGNIFLGDDGFGVEVVQRLAQRRVLPENVCTMDYGIRSYDLAYALMDDWDLVILVDAVPRGETPGTVYVIEATVPEDDAENSLVDGHSMNPVAVLNMVKVLGGAPGRMLLVGCEPESVGDDAGGEMGLTPPVEAAVEQSIQVIQQLITANRAGAA